MVEGRELTDAERKAVKRVERALAAIPDSIGLHFNEGGFAVIDRAQWNTLEKVTDQALDWGQIKCRYDTGAL